MAHQKLFNYELSRYNRPIHRGKQQQFISEDFTAILEEINVFPSTSSKNYPK